MKERAITILGGGTGGNVVARSLKPYANGNDNNLFLHLYGIVPSTDSGGSSGILRYEYGTVPAGDWTNMLIPWTEIPLPEFWNFRFKNGFLNNHTPRNVLFTMLWGYTNDMVKHDGVTESEVHKMFVDNLHSLMNAKYGKVYPATFGNTELYFDIGSYVGKGENTLDTPSDRTVGPIDNIRWQPRVKAYEESVKAITDADIAILCPGSL